MSKRTPPPPPRRAAARRRKADPPHDALAVLRGLLSGPGSPQATPDRVVRAMLSRTTKAELISLVEGLAAEAATRRPVGRPAVVRSTKQDPLGPERAVVWLEDVSKLPYVFERQRIAHTRLGPIQDFYSSHRVVGYSELDPATQAAGGEFIRRVFWLAGDDPRPDGRIPPRAVDPRSVVPGTPGRELRFTGEAFE